MGKGEGSLFTTVWFPFPWPPPDSVTIYSGEHDGLKIVIVARTDGRLAITVYDGAGAVVTGFVSQPIIVYGIYPAMFLATWSPSGCTLMVKEQRLLSDLPGLPPFEVMPPRSATFGQRSIDDPTAVKACDKWIQNRKSKFAVVKAPRPNRRPKLIEEEGDDLRNSTAHMKHILQHMETGETYLLGALAGEMRACVYWPRGRDSQPDDQWNPLLLRMASKADLPLPVYSVPHDEAEETTPLLQEAVMSVIPDPARIERIYIGDRICDLQEALVDTMLRIGPAPTGRTNIAIELIKELAHTTGAAHYDRDASEFIDVMRKIIGFDVDQVTRFMCHTAATLVSLSEWVLSELKTRKIIG